MSRDASRRSEPARRGKASKSAWAGRSYDFRGGITSAASRRSRSRRPGLEPLPPGLLVLGSGPRADHTLARLASFEEDRRGDREQAEPRGDDRVFVDVELRELDVRVCMREVVQDGLDRFARPAPRGPKVDNHRPL